MGKPLSPQPRVAARSTTEVFEDHLRRAAEGDVEGDIQRNFAPDVVLLTGIGVLRGHDGVRQSRAALEDDMPDGRFEYVTRLVDAAHAFLEWRADGQATTIDD
jgi:SnoaL-like domain